MVHRRRFYDGPGGLPVLYTARMRALAALFLIPLAGLPGLAARQQPPATDVFLLSMQGQAGGWINISNSPGYDNQPSFLPDSSAVLFSSNRDGKQTDIYRYDIASKALTQVTKTAEAEYSPVVTPDGKGFSVIRVEADGAQRLWRFDLDGANPRLVLENIKPVGYHAWMDATHLALFVLGAQGQPATLQIADTTTGRAEIVATGIGRSILIRPGAGTVSFITTGQDRWVKEWDPRTKQIAEVVRPVDNSQDAAWTSRNTLLMASGTSSPNSAAMETRPARSRSSRSPVTGPMPAIHASRASRGSRRVLMAAGSRSWLNRALQADSSVRYSSSTPPTALS